MGHNMNKQNSRPGSTDGTGGFNIFLFDQRDGLAVNNPCDLNPVYQRDYQGLQVELHGNGEAYNLHLRQLLHVGYKVAAQMGNRYCGALNKYESDVARNVTTNLWERHIKPLFL